NPCSSVAYGPGLSTTTPYVRRAARQAPVPFSISTICSSCACVSSSARESKATRPASCGWLRRSQSSYSLLAKPNPSAPAGPPARVRRGGREVALEPTRRLGGDSGECHSYECNEAQREDAVDPSRLLDRSTELVDERR